MDDKKSNDAIIANIEKLAASSSVTVVHGGGKAISKAMEAAGIKPRFINGLRYTDRKSILIVKKVLEKLQKGIVKKLKNGIGMTGISYGRRMVKLGYVGKFERADTDAISDVLEGGHIAVLNCLGRDGKGQWLNMNADDVASGIARKLKADKLIFFTDVDGVFGADGKTIEKIRKNGINALIEKGVITGGMIPKIKGCLNALEKGVGEINIVSPEMRGTKIL